ncbi:hypothetical protein NGM37_00990, partial [Streptomyces sp. TRM76130]|nr:hypothetical protein [Streptomyces sp. TRM76130]
ARTVRDALANAFRPPFDDPGVATDLGDPREIGGSSDPSDFSDSSGSSGSSGSSDASDTADSADVNEPDTTPD